MRGTIAIQLILAMLAVSCAHGAATAPEPTVCPVCAPPSVCPRPARVDGSLGIKGKSCGDYNELMATHKKSVAYVERWKESFGKIDRLLRAGLAPERDAEGDPVNDPSDYTRYTIEYVSGALQLTLNNEQLFPKNKPGLTVEGRDIVARLGGIIRNIDQRKITIGCRTTVQSEELSHTQWLAVRELSAKRATAILAEFEKMDIDPRSFQAASMSNFLQEDALERGTTILIFHPTPTEMPRYPDKI